MALVEANVMANTVMAKLYNILTNGDEAAPRSEDNFFSWATPGIPVMEEDFEFLSQGLSGVVKKAQLTELQITTGPDGKTSQPEITPAMLEKWRAESTAQLYMQAEQFARLVDFIPDVAKGTNNQFSSLSVMNNEGTLSEQYEYILRMSQVAKADLPEETKKKIEKFRGLLNVTKTKKNLLDDSEVQVSEPSPLVQQYNEKMKAYEDTALEYNSRRIDALSADNAKAIHYWSMNANILRNRVKAAMSDWVTNGYKNDYEQIAAFIDQVMQRDMSMLKEEYRDALAQANIIGMASGSEFYHTSLTPASFMKSSGWTRFTFNSSDYNTHQNSSYHYDRSSTSGSGGFLGIFGGAASTSSSSSEAQSNVKFDSEHFSLGFEITQVPIVRPWLKTAFLTSKSWRFDQSNLEAKGEMLSDGGKPPKGNLVAYPTSIIFIRNLSLFMGKSSGFDEFNSKYQSSSVNGGGYATFGGFYLGGSHGSGSGIGSSESNYHYDSKSQTMTVPGTQIIGFRCHVLPKSPDPLADITNWV
jgi:hypothetical protein